MPGKSHKNQKYSKELKQNAVQDYKSGKGSLRQISKNMQHKEFPPCFRISRRAGGLFIILLLLM